MPTTLPYRSLTLSTIGYVLFPRGQNSPAQKVPQYLFHKPVTHPQHPLPGTFLKHKNYKNRRDKAYNNKLSMHLSNSTPCIRFSKTFNPAQAQTVSQR